MSTPLGDIGAAPAAAAPAGGAPVSTSAPVEANVAVGTNTSAASGPEVDWDSWDGETSSLPEQYHDIVNGVRGRFESQYQERNSELDNLRAMYSAMLTDSEDPRIGQLNGQLSDLQAQFDVRNTEYGTLEDRYKQLQGEMEAYQSHNSRNYVDRFWQDHPELSGNEEQLGILVQYLEDTGPHGGAWDPYLAVKLMGLSPEALQVAVDAKKNGVADNYAFQLAEAHAKLQEAKAQPTEDQMRVAAQLVEEEKKAKAPRRGAKITNGAVSSSQPQASRAGMKDAKTLDEMRVLAARRALTVHGGGR